MITKVNRFTRTFADRLPDTHALLLDGELRVHDAVDRITLHGSRGLHGGARPDSDVDLCLVVNDHALESTTDRAKLLRQLLEITLDHWHESIQLDLAAVFDRSECGLRCLNVEEFDPGMCATTIDCMGLFKIQEGFNGFVTGPAVDCSKMYPLMPIWNRREDTT